MLVPITNLISNINMEGILDLASVNVPTPRYTDEELDSFRERETLPIPSAIISESEYEAFGHKEEVWKSLENQIVVDIGAGQFSFAYRIAEASRAKGYVAVESTHFNRLKKHMEKPVKKLDETAVELPYAISANDMRDFLRKVPDKSVSVLAIVIDWAIIRNQDYADDIEKEIERVKHPDGVFISDTTCAIRPKGLTQNRIKHCFVYR